MGATKTQLLLFLFIALSARLNGGNGQISESEVPGAGEEQNPVDGAGGSFTREDTNDTMPLDDQGPTEERFNAIEQELESLRQQVLSMQSDQPVAFDGATYDCIHRGIDCSDLTENGIGVYTMWRGDSSDQYDVMCQKDLDGAWTIIQRRVDDTVDFFRNWTEYVNGFGELGFETNFWFGLENMYQLTRRRNYVLRVELTDFDGNYAYADYDKFRVLDADLDYKLLFSSFSGGNAGDSLTYHNNSRFTTHDQDNDEKSGSNCAVDYHGAWWYSACYHTNLNGLYYNYKASSMSGMRWRSWGGDKVSKRVTMKIKPTY